MISRERRHALVAVGFLCALAVAVMAKPLIANKPFLGSDLILGVYDFENFLRESFRNGHMPKWNPFINAGTPAYASVGMFNTLRIATLWLPDALSLNVRITVSLALAGIGTFLVCRSLKCSSAASAIGGVTYMLAGCEMLRMYAGHLARLETRSWIPFVIWGYVEHSREKRLAPIAIGALAWSALLLVGDSQTAFYGALTVAVFAAVNAVATLRERGAKEAVRALVPALVVGAAGILIASVQLQSMGAWSANIARASTREFGLISTMPPRGLLTLLAPDALGAGSDMYWGGQIQWEESAFVGRIAVVLAVCALLVRRDRYTVAATIVLVASLLMMLGDRGGVWNLFYHVLPPFRLFRAPSRACVSLSLSTGVLAAITATEIARDAALRRRVMLGAFGALVVMGCAWSVLVGTGATDEGFVDFVAQGLARAGRSPEWLEAELPGLVVLAHAQMSHALLIGAGVLLLLVAALAVPWKERGAHFVALLALGASAELLVFDVPFVRAANYELLDPGVGNFIASDPEGRFLDDRGPNYANAAFPFRARSVGGYDPGTLRSFNELSRAAQSMDVGRYDVITTFGHAEDPDRILRAFRLLGLRHLLASRSPPGWTKGKNSPWSVVMQGPSGPNGPVNLYRLKETLPRTWIVHKSRIVDGRDANLDALFDAAFDPAHEVILESDATPPTMREPSPDESRSKATTTTPSTDEIVVQIETPTAGIAVTSEVYFPGWEATLDGVPATMWKADHALRAVAVPAGKHTLSMRFSRPPGYHRGAVTSLVSLVVGGALCATIASRRKKRS